MEVDTPDSLATLSTASAPRATKSDPPPTITHRDSVEDADATLTRKRLRLDSGDSARRSMSVEFLPRDAKTPDADSPTQTTGQTTGGDSLPETPSKVTPNRIAINVRARSDQSPGADVNDGQNMSDPDTSSTLADTASPDADMVKEHITPPTPAGPTERNDSLVDPGTGHLVLDSKDAKPPTDDPLPDREPDVQKMLSSFPLHGGEDVAFADSAKTVTSLLQSGNLEPVLLNNLSAWLDDHVQRCKMLHQFWKQIYLDEHDFWEEVTMGFVRLAARTKVICDESSAPKPEVGRLLVAYTRYSIHLARVDVHDLANWVNDETDKFYNLFWKCYKPLQTILNLGHLSNARLDLRSAHDDVSLPVAEAFASSVATGESGLQIMAAYAKQLMTRLHRLPALYHQLLAGVRLTYAASSVAGQSRANSNREEDLQYLRTLAHGVFEVFQSIDGELQTFIDGRMLSLPTTDARRDVLTLPAILLQQCAEFDDGLAAALFREIVTDQDVCSAANRAEVLANVWKMKLLKKCFVKSKMEMRVFAVESMSASLVDLWKFHSTRVAGDEVVRLLADILLKEQVANYIVGVDSHPNLISRSSNIIGFFIVSSKYGRAETDLIWNTVANSPDPRVVTATVQMISGMMSLLQIHDRLYLCQKLAQLPVQAFDQTMLGFWSQLFEQILSQTPGHWTDVEGHMSVFDLCVQVMRKTFPGRIQTTGAGIVHSEASSQLLRASNAARLEDREILYRQLIEDIESHEELAAANAEILFYMLRSSQSSSRDLDIVADLGLLRATIEDYDSFVHRWSGTDRGSDATPTMLAELGPRLDLISLLLARRPQSTSPELNSLLWDVSVGDAAINDTARDKAWCKLADLARSQQTSHTFLDMCLSQFLPKMSPELYTAQSFQFVESTVRYLMCTEGGPKENEDGTIDIPSVSLLWQIMLAVPRDSIEEPTVRLLAAAHQEATLSRMSKAAITKTHIAIADRCVEELGKEWNRAHPQSRANESSDGGTLVEQWPDATVAEGRFARITYFLGLLLQNIRSSAKYMLPTTQATKSNALASGITVGTPITIRYQAFNDHQGGIESLNMGSLETRRQLYNRLRDVTGFVSFKTILGGQPFDLLELPTQTLEDWGRAEFGAILVKEVRTTALAAHESVLDVGRCETELAILEHFDALYSFLAPDDNFSRLTYDFLATFPPFEGGSLTSLVNGSAALEEAFPSGRLYQIRYSMRCLQTRLDTQIRTKSVDANFVNGALRLLSSFAAQNALSSGADLDGPHIEAVNELVMCLHRFLLEATSQAQDLAEPARLADQLFEMTRNSARPGPYRTAAGQTYATLLELAAHSEQAWQAFCSREDLQDLHSDLLLESAASTPHIDAINRRGMSSLGYKVAVTIRTKVKSGLRWIHTSSADVAGFYWRILEPLIPHCLNHRIQPEELLQTANTVLEYVIGGYSDDELHSQGIQTALRGVFDRCVALLRQHEHTEFVGRNEADVVIKGLAGIAHRSFLALSRDMAEVSVDELIAAFSDRLLFPPLPTRRDSKETGPAMPVLDSASRKVLYDLLLDVCHDSASVQQLIQLVQDVLHTDDFSRTAYYREYMLRASSGLVGIRNLGNTCYMNALLTQLYMNIDFRRFILSLQIVDPVSQGLIQAIQALFAQMQDGFQKFVDASDLSRLISTFEGEPIDVSQQMDVEEFFNLKFDQTEAQILGEDNKKAFTSIYGGQMINQIKSQECEHVSERLEPYFAVQCDVKGKTSLLESLQAFVQGDVMEGDNKYKCEACGGRFVNAVKRTCLKDVPDNLIFHLKRFDFDIGTMQRSKINDFFEFPMRVDVSPFTFDHLDGQHQPDHEDAFDLVGVLLHKGVAEHGHYFSYIRSRPSTPGEPPRWFCFDDADVTEFSPSEIKEKCYGGVIDSKDLSFLDTPPLLKGYNAYMLFYQRVGTIENHQGLICADAQPPRVSVPQQLFTSVSQQNEILLREYTLLDTTHLRFVRQLLSQLPSMRRRKCSQSHELEDKAIRTALMYLHQVFSRNKDVHEFHSFLDLIQDMISGCHLCRLTAVWVIFPEQTELDGEYSIISDLLIRSTVGKIRQLFQDFVAGLISELKADASVSQEEYGVVKDDATFDHAFPFYGQDSVIVRVVQTMSYHMDHLSANTRSWDHFFGLLCSIAGLGLGEKAALLEHKIFTRCLELIVLKYDFLYDVPRSWRWLAKVMDKRTIPHNRLLELIDMMLDVIDLHQPESLQYDDRLSDFDAESQTFPLVRDEYDALTRSHREQDVPYFVYRILEVWDTTRTGRDYASKMFIRLYGAEIISSRCLYNTLLNGVDANSNSQAYLAAAAQFCHHAQERMVVKTVQIAVQSTLTAETTGLGSSLVKFFDTVASRESQGCPDAPLKGFELVVGEMPNWSQLLVLSSDSEVRDQAARLIRFLLLKDLTAFSTGPPIEHVRVRSVRVMASNLSRTLARYHDEGTAGKRTVRAAVNVVHLCKEHLSTLPDEMRDPNDDDLIARADELFFRHQQWPWQDEEHSDDWQSETILSDEDVIELP